jgi:hypothetical protein
MIKTLQSIDGTLDNQFFIITVTLMARPKKPDGESREKLMQVRVQDSEHKLFKSAAIKSGLDLSSWVRERLLQAARRETARNVKA